MYRIKLTKIAAEQIRGLESRTQKQILSKIESLKEEPLLSGKPLKGPLKDYRSAKAAGQRFRIIYKVREAVIIVIIIAVCIRKEGDKKDIYQLMKKLIKIGLIGKEEKS